MARTAIVVCEHVETREISKGSAETFTAYLALPNKEPVRELPFHPYMGLSHMVSVSIEGIERTNVLALIRETSKSKTIEPRDRLYTLRSLRQVDIVDIDVDYSKTTLEVCRDWARNHIIRNRNFSLEYVLGFPRSIVRGARRGSAVLGAGFATHTMWIFVSSKSEMLQSSSFPIRSRRDRAL